MSELAKLIEDERLVIERQQRRIAELEGAARADDERLRAAAERAGIAWVGCDTPDALAERVVELEAALELRKIDAALDAAGKEGV